MLWNILKLRALHFIFLVSPLFFFFSSLFGYFILFAFFRFAYSPLFFFFFPQIRLSSKDISDSPKISHYLLNGKLEKVLNEDEDEDEENGEQVDEQVNEEEEAE